MTTSAHAIHIEIEGARLDGELTVPADAQSVVAFAHGSGSGRYSPRNQYVAELLRRQVGCATLLVDLLSAIEQEMDEHTGALRFDIELLGPRLAAICDWLRDDERTARLPLGLFGASTGASAALRAASERREQVRAIVSRGGRPDLAGLGALASVVAPTLFIVGSRDEVVLELNQQARRVMRTECEVVVVEGAGHLFEEPGALDEVAQHAARWFKRHLLPSTLQPHM